MQRERQQLVTVEGSVGGYWRGWLFVLSVIPLCIRSFLWLCLYLIPLCVKSFLCSFVRSCLDLFLCLFVCSFAQSPIRSFVSLFVRLFNCAFVCSIVQSLFNCCSIVVQLLFNCLFILFIPSFLSAFVLHSNVRAFICSFVWRSVQLNKWWVHGSSSIVLLTKQSLILYHYVRQITFFGCWYRSHETYYTTTFFG